MRRLTRVLIMVLVVWAGWRALHLSAFHWWAADFPQSSNAAWHKMWGNVFFAASVVAVAIGVVAMYWLRPRRPRHEATGNDVQQ
jgi:hypothetical protein